MKLRNNSRSRKLGTENISHNKRIIPGYSAKKIDESLQYKKRQIEKKEVSEDTAERIGIHSEIQRLLGYGLNKKETCERLTEKFPNSKYICYFESWIADQYKKVYEKNQVNKMKEELSR